MNGVVGGPSGVSWTIPTAAAVVDACGVLEQQLGLVLAERPLVDDVRAHHREAGRAAARLALERAGAGTVEITQHEADGRPRWPLGWTGSISHGCGHAVAAVTAIARHRGVGIDIERSGALGFDEAMLVLDAVEREEVSATDDPARLSTLIWSAKESAFKAWSSMADGLAADVDPADIHVDVALEVGEIAAFASGRLSHVPRVHPLHGRFVAVDEAIMTVLVA